MASRTAVSDHSGGGFFVRRVASPGAAPSSSSSSLSSNKENLQSPSSVGAVPWRTSPLPEWFPRSRLGDVTLLLKAVEKKRMRDAAAAARQQLRLKPDDRIDEVPGVADSVQVVDAAASATSYDEEALGMLIEGLEKMVNRNLKRADPKANLPSKTREARIRVIMSMR